MEMYNTRPGRSPLLRLAHTCAMLMTAAASSAIGAQDVTIVRITDEDTPIRGRGVAPALHSGQVALLGRL